MPASPGRRKAAPRRPRSRPRKAGRARAERWRGGFRLLRDLLPLLVLLLVVLAVLILDPEAVIRLVWACVTGNFGTVVQLVVTAVVALGGGVVIWALWQPDPDAGQRPAARRSSLRRTRSGTARKDTPAEPKPRQRRRAAANGTTPDPTMTAPAAADDNAATVSAESAAASTPDTPEPRPTRKPRTRQRKAAAATGNAADSGAAAH